MSTDYPFTVEYAKSNRAGCKGCKMNIGKDQIRFGIMVQSPHFDGRVPLWYHANCFWKKAKLSAIEDLHGFDRLRWDDQEEIRNRVSDKGGASAGGAAASNGKDAEAKATDFHVEYSKTGGSKCKKCDVKIKKAEIRVGKKSGGFYHFKCFVESAEDLNIKFAFDTLEGFAELDEEDREELQKLVKPLAKKRAAPTENSASTAPKKIKVDPQEEEERLKLKEQSDALWKIKDSLQAIVKSKDMATLLEANGQEVPVQSSISERLADCMLFGGLVQCKECNNGQLVYSTSKNAYMCTGSISAFTKCQFETQDPERKPLVIPHEMKEEYPYLASFKFKKGIKRYFPMKRESPTKSCEDIQATALVKKGKSKKSAKSGFDNSRFVSSAPSSTKMVLKGGAAVDPDSDLTAVAHVFVDKGKNLFSVVLNMTDVQDGRNSYYKLQLLEHDKQKKFWVFRAWGRVGTTIGGNKLDAFNSDLESAKESFKTVYAEKTGNAWEQRHNFVKYPNRFMPVEVDYGSEEKKIESKVSAGSKSKLDKAIQDFIMEIFDIEKMKETMKEFELDLKKMPLGKLSKKQIEKAYEVLTDLQKALGEQSASQKTQILDCSNRFYTLIPHDFGIKKPTLLDTRELLQSKTEMLDSLLEIELAYSILKSEGDTGDKDPIDVHYEKLATDMQVVDKKAKEFKIIVDYVKNTHAATHTMYSLDVEDVFKICRHGEYDRFIPSKAIQNHMLLWHGSRTSNFAGILSQGLRIAPPEAPVTGYMFGKGIYFADMVSKSANYCCTTKSNSTGFLLLSDVALGNAHELLHADSNLPKGLPKGKQSVKGCGSTTPDPKQFVTMEDGVVVPCGKGVDAGIKGGSLLYNEYIVYDVGQVNLKYLVKAKFNYKY